jgi:hypothetical protein
MSQATGHAVRVLTVAERAQWEAYGWACAHTRCNRPVSRLVSYVHYLFDKLTEERKRVCTEHGDAFAKYHNAMVVQAPVEPKPTGSPGYSGRVTILPYEPKPKAEPVQVAMQPLRFRVADHRRPLPVSVSRRSVEDRDLLKMAS